MTNRVQQRVVEILTDVGLAVLKGVHGGGGRNGREDLVLGLFSKAVDERDIGRIGRDDGYVGGIDSGHLHHVGQEVEGISDLVGVSLRVRDLVDDAHRALAVRTSLSDPAAGGANLGNLPFRYRSRLTPMV